VITIELVRRDEVNDPMHEADLNASPSRRRCCITELPFDFLLRIALGERFIATQVYGSGTPN
jgi:hypothetical protein